MHNNFHFLKKLAEELNHKLIGFKIGSCFNQEKDELIIGLENTDEEFFIKCVATPSFSCLYFPIEYARARKNSVNIWPEILDSIKQSGITNMEIYRIENRLFMIMEAEDGFAFEKKAVSDANNPKVQEWETLMWKYQQALPTAQPGEKWMLMEQVFRLE